MQIASSKALINSNYRVEISLPTDGLTPAEAEAIAHFGEPVIACGGEFSEGNLTFELPSNPLAFPSQFPVRELFSCVDYPDDANERADLWKSTVKVRIVAAIQALRNQSAGNVGYEIDNIDTTPS